MSDFSDVGYNFEDIQNATNEKDMVIRLTDETSLTSLRQDGFTSNHSNFQPKISNKEWKDNYQHIRSNKEQLHQRNSLESIVLHINSGWNNRSYYNNSKNSTWISTTLNLNWSIWEISRRLIKLNRNFVYMTLIKRNRKFARFYKGTKDLYINPIEYIQDFESAFGYNVQSAINFATSASEILYYGRIFNKDILETTVWEADAPAFSLPAHYYVPKKYWTYGESWLDRLIWDPRKDSFYDAEEKILDRQRQIERSRSTTMYYAL